MDFSVWHLVIIGCLISFIANFLGWSFIYLMTEFKYLWCKGNCRECRNWKCRFFDEMHGKGD